MLSYKLAKQLKEAGFPQDNLYFYYVDKNIECSWVRHTTGEGIACPTLPELIDDCGEEFYKLVNLNGDSGWHAEGHNFKGGKIGKTPEEAVAKLWLKLNENK